MVRPGIYLHGVPARDLEHVVSYLTGDAHDRSKVEFFDGERFLSLNPDLAEELADMTYQRNVVTDALQKTRLTETTSGT